MTRPCGHAAPNGAKPTGRKAMRRAARKRQRIKTTSRVAVLAVAAAGIVTFSAAHKEVTINVNGQTSQVQTFAGSVAGVLAQEHVAYSDRDLVAPAPAAPVPRAGEIVVRTAMPMELNIDGEEMVVWTTAPTVDEALADLGVRAEEARLSVSRSASIAGLDETIEVSTPKAVLIEADGIELRAYSNAPSVRQVLIEVGVVLGPHDTVVPGLDAVPEDGMQIKVHRAQSGSDTETTVIPFETVEQEDPTLIKGTKVVKTPGRAGQKVTTYITTTAGGEVVARQVVMEVVQSAPVNQVVLVGTKVVSVPSVNVNVDPSSAQGIARQMMADSYGWGDGEFSCLVNLWNRESGWRVNAANSSSGAYGIPQALPGSKMSSAGADWKTNPATQIKWGLGYIKGRYGTPCGAWSAFQSKGWY
ncbi:MAG: ubiquitin-like domain-containing protein [Bifidobacteriaceae bacterium]|jgi:uncharacterized protein YabE (DUF348 family)|nr:ubiquitin-like domain-containing protein [Bifidobacteriaceae bacterium]